MIIKILTSFSVPPHDPAVSIHCHPFYTHFAMELLAPVILSSIISPADLKSNCLMNYKYAYILRFYSTVIVIG